MSARIKMTAAERTYEAQMASWLREQQARERDILNTIATGKIIIAENRKQLAIQRRRTAAGRAEFNAWRRQKGLAPV